jgi:hypothetical protein
VVSNYHTNGEDVLPMFSSDKENESNECRKIKAQTIV